MCDPKKIPVLENITLKQALRRIVDGLDPVERTFEELLSYPEVTIPYDSLSSDQLFVDRGQPLEKYSEAARYLLIALKLGEIKAFGFFCARKSPEEDWCCDEGRKEIPKDFWGSRIDWGCPILENPLSEDDEEAFMDIEIPLSSLDAYLQANPYQGATPLLPDVAPSKRGRHPLCAKEVWLERLLILLIQGEVKVIHKQDAIAQALCEDLKNNLDITVSVSTIKRNWVGEIFRKAKKEENKKKGK
ncbi:hypothetical protein [Terasakiella pusilla]|uniref:hypothetical protein n=1 Tax=Terasakiella pusilla TaxID=64973 RepID=UPI003AA95588